MKGYLRLLKFVKPYLNIFALAVVFLIAAALFEGLQFYAILPFMDRVMANKPIVLPVDLPNFLQNIVDFLNGLSPAKVLKMMIFALPILFLFKGFIMFWRSFLMSKIGQLVVRDIRDALYHKLNELDLAYFSQKRSGELISRITNDVRMVENAVSYGLTDLVYQSALAVFFTVTAFAMHWKVTLAVFLLGPFISLPVVNIGKALRKLSHRLQERMADINTILYETITGVRIVKAFNMQKYEIKRFMAQNNDYFKTTMKSIKRIVALGPLTEFIGAIAATLLLAWIGRDVINGVLSPGALGLLMTSLMMLIRPVKKLSQVNGLIQQALAAEERINDILEYEPQLKESQDAEPISSFENSIKFDNVWFGYEVEDAENLNDHGYTLKEINLEVKKGEVIAIVGPTGSGKTTLINLILRFYDPQQGRILIDGKDLKDLNIASLRRLMGIVTQETILFNDTVKANIAYGHLEASEEDISVAARKAFADSFIKEMPKGYNTVVGDRGFKLSGGEKQRLAIARAILKDPPILILDEATSQLDAASEKYVQEALDYLMQNRTVFVIAHRLSTVRKASKILVVNEGRIVESGTHEQLLKKQGLYSHLHSLQFQL